MLKFISTWEAEVEISLSLSLLLSLPSRNHTDINEMLSFFRQTIYRSPLVDEVEASIWN